MLKFIKLLSAVVLLLCVVCVGSIGVIPIVSELKRDTYYSYNLRADIGLESAQRFADFMLDKREGDEIFMHIESHGGLILSMHKILYYMDTSPAKFTCYVDSHASSAAAIILLSCDAVLATPKSEILIHITQMCTVVCTPTSPTYHAKHFRSFLKFIWPMKKFLTNSEWQDILDSKDVIILGEDLMKRLNRR